MKSYIGIATAAASFAALILSVFPTKNTLSKSLAWAAKLVAFVALLSSCVCSAHTPRHDQTLRLGGLRKYEKLSLFKARFPRSICGEPLDPWHINRHTLNDPDNSEWLTCCIDDPKEVSAFSGFKVLSRDRNCPVLVGFHRERLHDMGFAVDASSIETVLPEFEKIYGPIQHVKTLRTTTVPVRFAFWNYGDVTLELNEELLTYNIFEINPPPSDRSPEAKIVLLNLF
jgi:hypothetical protein